MEECAGVVCYSLEMEWRKEKPAKKKVKLD